MAVPYPSGDGHLSVVLPRGDHSDARTCVVKVGGKLLDGDPQAWLADVLRRIADHPSSRLDELLPWNCTEWLAKLAA